MKKNLRLSKCFCILMYLLVTSFQNFAQNNSGAFSKRNPNIASWPTGLAAPKTVENAVRVQSSSARGQNSTQRQTGTESTQSVDAGISYYVNDALVPADDHYTTGAGSDANPGTASLPFATLTKAIMVASDGDIIYVDAGTYRENILLDKSLSIRGSNFGVNPGTNPAVGRTYKESVIQPATSDTSLNTGQTIIYIAPTGIGSTIDGFTISGDNTTLTSGYVRNGADIDALEAIAAYDGIANITISNNAIRNFIYTGVDLDNYYSNGAPTAGNFVTNNLIYNILPSVYGIGVLIYDNCYTTVTNNTMVAVRIGVQTGNYFQPDPGNNHSISNNSIQSMKIGIFHNLHYTGATSFTLSANTMTAYTPGGVNINTAFLIGSILSSVGVNITGNILTGNSVGYNLWNNITTNTVAVNGGSINTCKIGVFANNFDGYSSDAGSSSYAMTGVNFQNTDTAVWVRDNSQNTNSATVALAISNSNLVNNSLIGVLLEGCDASVTFSGVTPVNFSSVTNKYIRLISNGSCLPSSAINATNVQFENVAGAAASLAQLFAIENKIDHKIDFASLGFVSVRLKNEYVTANSFYTPNTTTPSVQRGVDAATATDTVNIANGTYLGDVDVSKVLTIIGQSRDGAILKGLYTGGTTLLLNSNDVKVKDLTVTRDYQDWYNSTKNQGLILQNSERISLDNLLVTGNRNGFFIFNSKNFIIKNCQVENNRTGFQVAGALDGGQIINNFIRNNFTHGILFNFDQGLTTAINTLINNNNISGNWYSQISFQRANATPAGNVGDLTGLDMTCNWLGSTSPSYSATPSTEPGYASQTPSQLGGTDPGVDADIKGVEAARIPYIPYLTSGTDNDAAAGFQPVPGSCSGRTLKYYVNDASQSGDVFTTAVGNNANPGTAASPFATINYALSKALAGDSIYVDAGTYSELVVVNKSIIIRGAGAATTILTAPSACTGNGITISANNVAISSIKITNFSKGIFTSFSKKVDFTSVEVVSNCTYGIELANRSDSITILGSKVNSNTSLGIRTGTTDSVTYVTIRNSEVKSNGEGLDIAASSSLPNQYDYLTIVNCDFSNNLRKGMYIEKVRHALIDSVTMNSSGTDATYATNAGIDINLKYGTYTDIIIRNSNFTNSGANGTGATIDGPVVIAVKARDDAPSYNSNPAVLTAVTIRNNIISGPQNGLRFGEPGKINNSPTGSTIVENNLGAAFANKAIINYTASSIPTSCNWFGTSDSTTIAGKVTTPGVTFVPYLFNGTDNEPAKPGFQPVPNSCGDNQAPSIPANLTVVNTARNFVNLDWDNSTDNVGVTSYDIYVNGVKTYTSTTSNVTANGLSPNTTYAFTVKALDQNNNASGFSNAVNGTTKSTGLDYKYYEGTFTTLPNFNTLTPVKTGNTPNIDLSVRTAGRNDNYAFLWQGYINIPAPGDYTFETFSDDGSKFYFNTFYNPAATALVNNDGVHYALSATGNINIPAAGLYPVTISYFEKDGGETMQLFWTGPGISRQLVPNSAFSNDAVSNDNLAPSVPANLRVVFAGSDFIDLDWDNSTDNVGVTGYDVYVNGIKQSSPTSSDVRVGGLTQNTSYTFTVNAHDAAGNNSALCAPVMASTVSGANGLTYKYYEGSFDFLPNFSTLTPVKTGSTPNIDISVRNPGVNDNYAFLWEGYINITTPGNYTFETISDDGSKFYFNTFYSPGANALVSNDGIHAPTSKTGTVSIAAAGLYPIAATFFEKNGGETMQLYWTGPGIPRQLIPDAAFKSNNSPQTDNQPPSVPGNVRVLYSARGFVNLDWDNSSDNVAVTTYDIYVDGVKKFTTTESAVTVDNLNPSTTYSFTVNARDLANNVSAFSSPAVTATTLAVANGLNYRYYEGSFNLLPNFNNLTPVKTGLSPNVDLSVRNAGVNDNFAFVWEGYINIPVAGAYTFETVSDDGSRFYFNSVYVPSATALVNNDGLHAANSATGTVTVNAPGLYPVAITYFEKDGGETMQVYWTGPGIPRQAIPNAAFTGNSGPATDNVAPSAPANLRVVYTGKGYVHLDWNDATDNVGVTSYDIYVGGVKTYTSTESAFTANNLAANTPFNFTVRARDLAGNTSDPSNTSAGSTTATSNGLNYRFYQGSWNLLPNFNTLTPVSSGSSSNVNIGVRTPGVNDNFGFVWEGYINIINPGNYTFETVSDDGSRLYFNSFYVPGATALVNNDGLHAPNTATASINIPSAGLYPIAMTYFEKDGGETMQVYWTGPGIARQQIPNSAFTESAPFAPISIDVTGTGQLGSIAGDAARANIEIRKIYPNPFIQSFNVDFYNSAATNDIRVGIYDMRGRLIFMNHIGNAASGNTTVKVNMGSNHQLSWGTYMVGLYINGKPSRMIKLVKVDK